MSNIVFYDGICGLCNWSVRTLIKIDRKKRLRYASLQSEFAEKSLKDKLLEINGETIIYLEDNEMMIKSAAIVRILNRIGGVYRMVNIFLVIPQPWRDAAYDWISRNRYRWFGRYETCPLPGPDEKDLFIEI